MNELLEEKIGCPYCGESIVVLVDGSECGQNYIEDCQVCCRPIEISLTQESSGAVTITVRSENE